MYRVLPVLAHCTNRINKSLSSQPDLIGIAWGLELKHKTNKGKQKAKGTTGQSNMQERYETKGIPYMIANESDAPKILTFLQETSKKLNTNKPLYQRKRNV